MSRKFNRKTASKVIGGHVLRKNNHTRTVSLGYVVDRERPRKGYKHVLKKKDVHDFIDIIPGWHEYADGLEEIILTPGGRDSFGSYYSYSNEDTGVIYLAAWNEEMWMDFNVDFFDEHKWLFDHLGLTYEEKVVKDPRGRGTYTAMGCYFSASQAKAFMLLNVFLHEIGHHVNRRTKQVKEWCPGGEPFAEKFADDLFHKLWPAYVDKFGHPERE